LAKKYRYHHVNLPMALADKINEVVESRKHGYLGITDFVIDAVRRRLDELGFLG